MMRSLREVLKYSQLGSTKPPYQVLHIESIFNIVYCEVLNANIEIRQRMVIINKLVEIKILKVDKRIPDKRAISKG